MVQQMEGCRWDGLWLGVGALKDEFMCESWCPKQNFCETTAHWNIIKSNIYVPQSKLTLAFSVDCYRDKWSTQQMVMMIYELSFFARRLCWETQ